MNLNSTLEAKRDQIRGVTAHHLEVRPGFVFVAVRGEKHDGHAHIAEAVTKGAILILGEDSFAQAEGVPYVRVSSARQALASAAAWFYEYPSRSMTLVGVTGTSGKTTTAFMIESILRAAGRTSGRRTGLIGTIEYRVGEQRRPAPHTTPGAVELQALLAEMRDAGVQAAVMEVSSHAIAQERSRGLAFDVVVFTNLSPEHLDYHHTMEEYFAVKARLFSEYIDQGHAQGKRTAAVVGPGPWGDRLITETLDAKADSSPSAVWSVGQGGNGPRFNQDLTITLAGICGTIVGRDRQGVERRIEIQSPLTGYFNADNLLCAAGVGLALGLPTDAIKQGLSSLEGVPGRLERVPSSTGIHVLVDYAHKPDALQKVLETLRAARTGGQRIITVFGCGGDRDRGKRSVMGETACRLSDAVVITSDNPRSEDPLAIIGEIQKGAQNFGNFAIEPDRRAAINQGIRRARPGDVVLIAGKGHETYQQIGQEKIPFDDREIASEALTSVSKNQ